MCTSCFFLKFKTVMQIKKEYLPNPALHAFEPLLNNFYNHCVNSHKHLKMLFPRLVFDILLLV